MPVENRYDRNQVLRAIESLSGSETPLERNVNEAGPGGQAYDRAPSPTQKKEDPSAQKENLLETALAWNDEAGSVAEKVSSLAEVASEKVEGALASVKDALSHPGRVKQGAEKVGRRASEFIKKNRLPLLIAGSLLAALAIGRKLGTGMRAPSQERAPR